MRLLPRSTKALSHGNSNAPPITTATSNASPCRAAQAFAQHEGRDARILQPLPEQMRIDDVGGGISDLHGEIRGVRVLRSCVMPGAGRPPSIIDGHDGAAA